MNNLEIFHENIHTIENVKLFTNENKLIFDSILLEIKKGEILSLEDLKIDKQLIERISKFAPIKHILDKHRNDQNKVFEILGEILRAFEVHGLEIRIQELESKFSKDLSETTFNEINDLKEEKKRKNVN